jgi:hypothetical protein
MDKLLLHYRASHPQNTLLFHLPSVYFSITSKLNIANMNIVNRWFEEAGISFLFFNMPYQCLFGERMRFKLKIIIDNMCHIPVNTTLYPACGTAYRTTCFGTCLPSSSPFLVTIILSCTLHKFSCKRVYSPVYCTLTNVTNQLTN